MKTGLASIAVGILTRLSLGRIPISPQRRRHLGSDELHPHHLASGRRHRLNDSNRTGLVSASGATIPSDVPIKDSWNPSVSVLVHTYLTALAPALLLSLCTVNQRRSFFFLSFIWASCSQLRPHLGDIGRVFVPWLALRWGSIQMRPCGSDVSSQDRENRSFLKMAFGSR